MAGVVASQSSGRTDRRLTVHLLLGVLGRLSAEVQRQSFAEIRVDGEEELLSFALNPDLYDPELADDMLAQGIRVGGQVAYRSNRAVTSPSAAREGVVVPRRDTGCRTASASSTLLREANPASWSGC